MGDIFFSSNLGCQYKEELEKLLFFNPQQYLIEESIIESIERYGVPKIIENSKLIRVQVEKLSDVQSLFAFENINEKPLLIGVIVYFRNNLENIIILHISIRDEFSTYGIYSHKMLVCRFIIELRNIARRVKGIRTLTLLNGKNNINKILV